MKTCTKCRVAKTIAEFHKHKRCADGLQETCKACVSAYSKARYAKNRVTVLASAAEYRKTLDPEKTKEYHREYHKKNKAVAVARTAQWRKDNPERYRETYEKYRDKTKDKKRASDVKWRVENRDRHRAIRNKRKALQRGAVPSFANQFLITEIYDLASRRSSFTGIKWHVDHVVPLISPIVCGLHVETNLAVVPASENIAKSNRRWPDMP